MLPIILKEGNLKSFLQIQNLKCPRSRAEERELSSDTSFKERWTWQETAIVVMMCKNQYYTERRKESDLEHPTA
jgi:hypothetical protein